MPIPEEMHCLHCMTSVTFEPCSISCWLLCGHTAALKHGTQFTQDAVGHAGWCAGRSLLSVRLSVGGTALRFATVHLESPVPGALASAPRKEQLTKVGCMLSAYAQHCC